MPSRSRRFLPYLLTALVAFVAGLAVLAVGIWIGGRHPDVVPKPVRASLTGPDAGRVVNEALREIEQSYYRKIPSSQLADTAIAGAVKELNDRFSNYFTPEEYRRFKEVQGSRFTGIGVTVAEDPAGLRVVQVFDGSPAERAGIRDGDVITRAEGESLKGKDSAAATALIKGPSGTDVRITTRRDGKDRDLTLTRSQVTVPVVASTLREVCGKKIGVVALSQFSSGAHAEVYDAIRRLEKRGAQAFVFDLRGNGGGLVDEAQLVASAFLPDGKVVTTRGRSVPERTLEATGSPVVDEDTPVVVLVDRGTASASEIVAGALQDRDRATIVGTRTFGKGVFQEVIELTNGGALDITAGQYFTPNGRNLGGRGVRSGTGLKPDVRAKDDPDTRVDEGLRAALDEAADKAGCAERP
jgi:carboxyl-terminal processing protease